MRNSEVGMRKWEFGTRNAEAGRRNEDPSSSDEAGLPSSLFELRRDMMPRLKLRIADLLYRFVCPLKIDRSTR